MIVSSFAKILLVNSVTSGDTNDNGIIVEFTEEILNKLGDKIKDGFTDFLTWIAEGIFKALTPIVHYGGMSAIFILGIIYFFSEDKKALGKAMVIFFLYILFYMLRSVVL